MEGMNNRVICPVVYVKSGMVYINRDCSILFTCPDNCSAARYYSNQGAEIFAVIEYSDSDAEHEKNLTCIKGLVAEAEIPVFAGGQVKRFEDVKKYLYTGAEKALFLFHKDTQEKALPEAAARFGKEKIVCVCNGVQPASQDIQEYVGEFCIIEGLGELPEGQYHYQLVSGEEAVAKMSKKVLSCHLLWNQLKTNSDGLIPVVVQDYRTNQVLMLAYMDEQAYQHTLDTGKMTYYSRSRKELWVKGLTSGHFQYVKELLADCDKDTLLAKVSQIGNACHTGSYSCFFEEILKKDYRAVNPLEVLTKEYQTILDRKAHPKEGSYTNYLFDKGMDKILKKVGEEATEIIIAAKNPDPEEIKYEISDFLYHVMVLMAEKGATWEDITREISNR